MQSKIFIIEKRQPSSCRLTLWDKENERFYTFTQAYNLIGENTGVQGSDKISVYSVMLTHSSSKHQSIMSLTVGSRALGNIVTVNKTFNSGIWSSQTPAQCTAFAHAQQVFFMSQVCLPGTCISFSYFKYLWENSLTWDKRYYCLHLFTWNSPNSFGPWHEEDISLVMGQILNNPFADR